MAIDASPAYLLGRFVVALDRAADRLLRRHVGVSYKRFLFLTVLQHRGTVTQHELAIALGYSDPAVSTMLVQLAKDGYVQATASATHGRKRLVTITPQGSAVVVHARRVLDAHFDQLLDRAGVDAQQVRDLAERLHRALMSKLEQEPA